MFTKDQDKLVQVIPQPDMVVAMTHDEITRDLEASKARRDIKVMELAGAEQEVARLEEMLAKCAELGIVEEEVVISHPAPEDVKL